MVNKLNIANQKLAIVIPAYKVTYLQETLQSLAKQTFGSFRVYIGDDGSPYDIKSVVASFYPFLDIIYKRFDSNLGACDLVAHWERCIDMVEQEDWIWFFSDDDKMDSRCVESFYNCLPKLGNIDLFHFNVKQIDGEGEVLNGVRFPDFPVHYRVEDFCRDRLLVAQQSYVVEFIFRKSKFYEVGRFQNFDLAWGTDVATCIKLGFPNGIATIPDAKVYWRVSDQNISPNNSPEMVSRKLTAVVDFFDWLNAFAGEHKINFEVSPIKIYLRRWLSFRGRQGLVLTLRDLFHLVSLSGNEKGFENE